MGINFSNVSFRYNSKSDFYELKDINLNIDSHDEFIMILGHTGSGKSTLVQLMNGLLLPTKGEIKVFDQTITSRYKGKLKKVRQNVGLVFQFPEYQLFEETVLKDVMFGPKNFGKTIDEAKLAAIKACQDIGIPDTIYEKPPFNLSGGQMRKVAIAGILASDPQVLILDEPTAGLDPTSRIDLMNLLSDLHNNTSKTIIVITHDMNIVAQYAKRVIVLKDQHIVFDGKKTDLFNDYDLLHQVNLDLPTASKLAIKLKERGLITFDQLPLTIKQLEKLIH